ncbi:phospholipase A1-like [Spodoptera litura]|uniref:Phospholipase A1-like n=1 Tax=Spodoptera litura TaxID=69820 RepID=A0A9J7DLU5_SPOLT|nr:phospholipase A1-like [Spodoptera litura]
MVLVNWEDEANPGGLANYFAAARNSQTIGTELGQAISTMVAGGLNPNNIILVGFSLGAQMCGRAGFVIQNIIGQPLPLIVGLDAAKPLFEPIQIFRCIKSTDASSVILVHSDMSLFGVSGSYGTQNFFANDPYYTSHGYQPGCSLANTLLNPIFLFENFNFFRIGMYYRRNK